MLRRKVIKKRETRQCLEEGDKEAGGELGRDSEMGG